MPKVTKQVGGKQVRRRPAAAKQPDAWDLSDAIKLNLYGRSGTGKTTLWSTFPGPILAIVCSGSIRPGELKSINTPENRKKITAPIVRHVEEIAGLLRGADQYATVVLDHASGVQDLVLKEILGLDELPAQRSWGLASQQQWGQCALQTKEVLRAVLNHNGNVVIVAQEREFNSDTDGDEIIAPYVGSALTPSVTGWLNPACDYIGQTFIRRATTTKNVKLGKKVVPKKVPTGKVEYCLRTAPDPVYTTKFRVPKGHPLPQVLVDPTYDKILAVINGQGKV